MLVVVFVGGLLAAAFIRFTETFALEGWLVPAGGEVRNETASAGTVARILSGEGTRVSAGQAVIAVATDRSVDETGDLGPVLMKGLDDQRSRLLAQLNDVNTQEAADADEARAAAARIDRNTTSQRRQVEYLRQRLSYTEEQRDQFSTLVDRGFGSRAELSRREEAVIAALQALESGEQAIADLESLRSEQRARQRSATARRQSQRSAIEQSIANVEVDMDRRRSDTESIVRATIAGRVATLNVAPGDRVVPGSSLFTIQGDGQGFTAILLARQTEIARLSEGHLVRLQVAAYPSREFGVLEGRVVGLSATPLRPGDILTPTALTEPAYRVTVMITSPAHDRPMSLRSGMTVRGLLLVRERTLLGLALGSFRPQQRAE
ncbi:HlyD family secretion protein [Brevundimonas variabilis]|uniref:Membrane fusion protein n=1 Tax=Brevundimonas variabilis TaxID=74312 RepID=A0A7W9CK01_9CAUL|nr:HlyD family efflux transporter periplasmic adaptor subunit [Brevundimonas variabilis]MBB5747095.1 membrane fusion protein [Brevundimonas variabilis]